MSLNESIIKVENLMERLEIKHSPLKDILPLHESTTKLWCATQKNDIQEATKQLSDILIGTFIIANHLGIKDLEIPLNNKLEKIKNQ